LDRRGALVGDLAARGATEPDAVLGAAVDSQEHARAGARVRRHDLHEWLLTGTDLPLDLHLERERSIRGLRELGELDLPVHTVVVDESSSGGPEERPRSGHRERLAGRRFARLALAERCTVASIR